MAAKDLGRGNSRRRVPARNQPLNVTVVLLDGGFASTSVAAIEVFHSAGLLWNRLLGTPEQPRFRVRTASISGRSVQSASALGLMPQHAISEIDDSDIALLAAPGPEAVEGPKRKAALLDWLRREHARGALVGGICSGVGYVAETGLLDGRRATTHWALADTMRQRFPRVLWQPECFVTEDGGVLCSGGVYAAVDLSLYLVERFCGPEVALQCARSLLLSMPRASQQLGYGAASISRPHKDDKVRLAEEHLQAHFTEAVQLDQLAGMLAMSPRNLLRRFKAATGQLPGAYQQALRVAAARDLLERSNEALQGIAEAVGYEDVAFFREVFKRHSGMTPAEYRRRFAPMNFERGSLAFVGKR